MKKVGFVGWRGMVGSVLDQRLTESELYNKIDAIFFSTSQVGQAAPSKSCEDKLWDANSLEDLKKMDIILTCQGGDYTKGVYPELRNSGWNGYWIDAASALRLDDQAMICLSPINEKLLLDGISKGTKTFVGGNCTVSLMLMAIGELFKQGHVQWLSSMTYQAASGAGAKNMVELIEQMGYIHNTVKDQLSDTILSVDKSVTASFHEANFPKQNFGAALAGSLIPWIDSPMESGQTREEWKGQTETNKILGTSTDIPVDGTCVRMGAMRCHSQAFTIKLKSDIPLGEIEDMIKQTSPWTKFVANNKEDTLAHLSPAAVSGKLDIPVGRVRKMTLGKEYLNAFTVGDQLLWGAAEPLKCMLEHILEA